jgi:hypothetical protein
MEIALLSRKINKKQLFAPFAARREIGGPTMARAQGDPDRMKNDLRMLDHLIYLQ